MLKHGHFQAIEDCFIHIPTLIGRAQISNCKTHCNYANQQHNSARIMTTIKKMIKRERSSGKILCPPGEFSSNNKSTFLF